MKFTRVLVLGAHPDDGELGCAATVARFLEEGADVHWAVFSECEGMVPEGFPKDIMPEEYRNSMNVLGVPSANLRIFQYEVRTFPAYRQEILQNLVEVNKQINPDLVLVPSSADMHQDHHTIYAEALRAFKRTASIWGYEQPWNNLSFTTDIFIKLKRRHLQKKINALREYKSQQYRTFASAQYLRALAHVRGVQIDYPYVEAFELVRLVV